MMQFNENNELELSTDAFIIPNRMSLTCGEVNQDDKDLYQKIYDVNNLGKVNPDSKIIQLWFVPEEKAESENLVRHGVCCVSKDGIETMIFPPIECLPYDLFKGHKEGDVIDLVIPARQYKRGLHIGDPNIAIDYTLKLHIKLNQSDYRYRRFGKFEDVAFEVTM